MSAKSIVRVNFYFLTILQVVNISVPIITIPFLLSRLGSELYGLVVWSQTLVFFFIVFIRYGFDISITKEVSINRDNNEVLSLIVSSVLAIKLLLFVLSAILMLILVSYIEKLKANEALIYFWSITAFSEVFSMPWFFQGIEKMRFTTYSVAFSRMIYLLAILFFVIDSSDYYLVPLISGICALIASTIYLYAAFGWYRVGFCPPTRVSILAYLKSSTPFFLSRTSVTLIYKFNYVLIEHYVGLSAIAFYDLAEKIVSIARLPFSMYSQALFPHLSKSKDMGLVRSSIKSSFLIGLLVYGVIVFAESKLFGLIGDESMQSMVPLLDLFGLVIVFSSIDYFLGMSTLVVRGYTKEFNLSVVYAAITYLLLVCGGYLFFNISLSSLVASLVVAEFVQLLYRVYVIQRHQLLYN